MPSDGAMTRFVLNARHPDSAAAAVCIQGLARELAAMGCAVRINDWDHYDQYDVAIFMAADADVAAVKQANPAILVGVADPKPSTIAQARAADFCLVSSIEQREVFLPVNRNQFIYYMIPDFTSYTVDHQPKALHRIFYHGNKVHLNGSYHALVPALNELGRRYPIEFHPIYNIRALGPWTMGRPDSRLCPTIDHQWYPDCYKDYLAQADIGVVQNLMPVRAEPWVRALGRVSTSLLLESPYDHLSKFKSSSNAGRAFVFGYFGIPVVAEATPSLGDAIVDGHSGFLVLGAEGWFDAIETLMLSVERRRSMARNFRQAIETRFAPGVSASRLLAFLSGFERKSVVTLPRVSPSVLAESTRDLTAKVSRGVRRVLRRP